MHLVDVGFNEAYIGWENVTISKAAVSMPTALFLYGLQNHFASTESDIARQVREARARADSYSAQMKKTHLAVHYYVLEILRDRSRTAEAKTEGEISQRVEGRVYPIVVQGESGTPIPQMADEIASIWYRGSLMMKAAADTIGAAYIQMLQPNQYYGNRVFSEAEKKIAFQTPTPHPAATIVPPVFSRMLELAKGFRQRDINFIDATTAFDGISESIYFDTCCHFNQRGYDILVNDYLAKAIPAALAQREK